MQYLFSNFILDTNKKELYYNSKLVVVTKQSYYLLLYFVKNPGLAVSKEELIEKIWSGKGVADNTIDQSIYKLRKILTTENNRDYFEIVYGLGVKFLPTVEAKDKLSSYSGFLTKINKKYFLFSVIVIFFALVFLQLQQHLAQIKHNNNYISHLMVIPNQPTDSNSTWYKSSSSPLIEKLLSRTNKVYLKNYQDKPDNLSQLEFLKKQWNLYPNLKVISTDITLNEHLFEVSFSITNKQQQVVNKIFINQNLGNAFKQGKKWLIQQINDSQSLTKLDTITLENTYLLEMYMRGLSAVANNKADQAVHFFELCIQEDPNYHVAAFELAKLLDKKGNQQRALALIDVLLAKNDNPILDINVSSLRGGILLRQGKPDAAKEIFMQILDKYKKQKYVQLIAIRYQLSMVLRSLSANDKALEEINKVESQLATVQDYQTLAEVYQYKGSLFLKLGKPEMAKTYMDQAMTMFVKTDDLYNIAKTHSGIARLLIQQADYVTALEHLKQSLDIVRSIGEKFGTGATLNEMIRALLAIGKITQAAELNQEMEQIAREIDFTAMLLAAKIHQIKISILLGKWQLVEIYLKQHLELATAANNQIALIQNKLLELDFNLVLAEKNMQSKNIQELTAIVQDHIVQSKEVIMQPGLNREIARGYLLLGKKPEAISLLLASIELAEKIDDVESIIAINNLLANIYLDNSQAQKALSILESITTYKPVAYPYLLLKSKAYSQLNQQAKAVEFASMCKRMSNELWQLEDQQFYAELITRK